MDKNTLIGITLCIAIFIGFSIFNRPSEEQLAMQQRQRDSIAQVQQRQKEAEYLQSRMRDSLEMAAAALGDTTQAGFDSLALANYKAQFGKFAPAATGADKDIVISNNKMIVTLSTKGAMIKSVQLKDYKTNSGDSLFVMKRDPQNEINLDFFAGNNAISTKICIRPRRRQLHPRLHHLIPQPQRRSQQQFELHRPDLEPIPA